MVETLQRITAQVAEDGYVVIDELLSAADVHRLRRAVEAIGAVSGVRQRRSATYAVRNLFDAAPATRDIVCQLAVVELVTSILGADAFVNRAILFDKNSDANWAVPWHQDTTIAVNDRPTTELVGFGPWSVKAGVHHVQPPAAVLDDVIAVRIHLDDCGEDNAPLRVIPGSHRHGILDDEALHAIRTARQPATCTVKAGGVLLMKPLLLHASSPARIPGSRRVIHLEWTASSLPGELEWNRA